MKAIKPKILIIGGRDSSVNWPGQECFDLLLIQERDYLSERQAKIASIILVDDLSHVQSYLGTIQDINKKSPFAAVVSFFEKGLLPAAEIGEILKIPHNSYTSVNITRKKSKLREQLIGSPYEIPFAAISSTKEAQEFYHLHGCCILKPIDGSGSMDVHKIESILDPIPVIRQQFIAEKYIEGEEYSVETFTKNGRHRILGITKKYTTGSPNFVETGHDFPTIISRHMRSEIRNSVYWLLNKIKHNWGPCHTEIKIDRDQIFFIEAQTRFGGDQIWEMIWRTTGIHLAAATVYALANKHYRPSPIEFSFMAIRFPKISSKSLADCLQKDLEKHPFIVRLELKEENFGKPFLSSSKRHGYALFGCRLHQNSAAFQKSLKTNFFLTQTKE